ncbi:unnamed protein product [Timema podura]|uniref:Endonuclease/exonuclease/phosphatase domain-containing protein n=1 Tax=Timema podura TaxID=61482 RepID=A0ABN7NZP3_TIMPD|nr:unnamed protein product [Timema podura]
MAVQPNRGTPVLKDLTVSLWNANGVAGKKVELERFLSKHRVDVMLLGETHLRSAMRFSVNRVYLPSERPSGGCGKGWDGAPGLYDYVRSLKVAPRRPRSTWLCGFRPPTPLPQNPLGCPDFLDFAVSRGIRRRLVLNFLAELDLDHNPVLVNLGRAVFTPRHRPKRVPQASLPDSILRHVREINRLRKTWQISRDLVDKPNWSRKVHVVREMIQEYRNSVWEDKVESLCVQGRSLRHMTRNLMRVPAPRPPIVGRKAVANSDKEKADALAEHLEAQFVPTDDPSDRVHIAYVAQVIGAVSYRPLDEPEPT